MPALITETLAEIRRQAASRAFLIALVVILPCAAFLVGLDAAYIYGRTDGEILPWQLNISEEGSLAEWFEYALTFGAAVLMVQLWRRERAPVFLGAAITFLWLTSDNALALHEAAGAAVSPLLIGPAGERAADLGELIVFSLVAMGLGAMLRAALLASAPRAASRALCALGPVALGAAFGVAMDFVSHLLPTGPTEALLLDFVEDGGELAMLCLATAFAAATRFDAPAAEASTRVSPKPSAACP